MFFGLLILLAALFHREIIFEILEWLCQASRADSGRASVRLRASLKKSPHLYIMKTPLLETIVIPRFFRDSLWVNPELWESLTENERECLLVWAQSSCDRNSFMSRVLGFTDPRTADRDCLLICQDPLSFPSLLDKAQTVRGKNPPTNVGTLFAGASLLGPPLIGEGVAANDRMKAYADQLTRLKK